MTGTWVSLILDKQITCHKGDEIQFRKLKYTKSSIAFAHEKRRKIGLTTSVPNGCPLTRA